MSRSAPEHQAISVFLDRAKPIAPAAGHRPAPRSTVGMRLSEPQHVRTQRLARPSRSRPACRAEASGEGGPAAPKP